MTRDEAAAASRALRHAAARYQSSAELPELTAFRTCGPALYHYSVTSPRGLVVSGLVGLVHVASLLPHEETIREAEDREAADMEIRPLLAISRVSLPATVPVGAPSEVRYGAFLHRAVPVAHQGGLDLGPLVLADGHHRRRAAMRRDGDGAQAMTLVVGDSGRGLRANAFQRRLLAAGPLPASAADSFEIASLPRAAPRAGAVVWVQPPGPPQLLTPRPEALLRMAEPLRTIGAAVAAALLYPLLGVTQERIEHFATPTSAIAALRGSDAAVLLPAVRISAVLAAAAAGVLLPPKGSRFEPKPVRGLVVRAAG